MHFYCLTAGGGRENIICNGSEKEDYKLGCTNAGLKHFKQINVTEWEEGNTFNTVPFFLKPSGYTQCILVSNIAQKTQQGTFKQNKSGF